MDWQGPPWHASGVMNGPLPLDGLRVLELGHIIAGPSAGLLLADLGADVIKVERPGEGDQTRGMPAGNGANFHFLNRNKRSITIDLKGSPEGRALFLRLARGSDIVIDNFAYGAVEGLGLGYDVLERENPRIIYMALKGFLPGPYEARPFLDELAQMSAGLAFMTGPRGQPMRAGASIVDVGAAAYGVIAVLAALQQRAHTGRGQKITSGLYETTVFWMGQWLANYGATGEPSVPMPEIRQGTRMGWGIYQLFTAADGEQVFVGITSNEHWERFCTEFGLADLLADERLNDNSKRVAARAWLPARIAEEMLKYPSAALAERLERAKIPFAPLRRPDQLVDDPHLNASEQWMATPLPGRPPAKLPKMPLRSTAYDFSLRRPAPQLGEHTREVLQEFGLSKDDIDALASRRVIG
jgi:crotonobetainyl-CoA:carnitine CoA-transferase CaiB-like acyl-CoA transferase